MEEEGVVTWILPLLVGVEGVSSPARVDDLEMCGDGL